MYKILKTLIVCAICFNSYDISAQLNEYLNSENNRISSAKQIEVEIKKFINDNFDNYILSQEINDDIIAHLRAEEQDEFTQEELDKAIVNTKIYELRKLFFVQNPDRKDSYFAKGIPISVQQQCVNGDFENDTAGYSFWSDAHPQPATGTAFFLSCATPSVATALNVVTPVTNDFNAAATLIDNTSPGYQQFDPTLAGLGVNIPTLYTAGGNKCIKLNNEQGFGSSDITTVSRYFPNINQATIDFNFSLIMDNKPSHGQPIQPFFRVRALDQFGNVVDEICIVANPDNCLFNVIYVNSKRRVLYTDWICARLNVGEILNQPGTIEFTISDCQPSAHFGTVYIDNICGSVCAFPQLGALNTNPTNINCPDTIGNTPIQVCGTYSPPYNATLSSMILNITQNGTVIGTINAPTQLTANTFCFNVLPSIFGANPTGDFEFQIDANFTINCPAGTFLYTISDNSANIGPDVTFIDCCLPTLTLASPADDVNNLATLPLKNKERSNWIKATNIVSVGDNVLSNGVVYHAANYVELNPGFEAVLGAQFSAYPEGCTANYIYKTQLPNASPRNTEVATVEETIHLIKVSRDFAIVPNPSSSTIEIIMKDAQFDKISITTIDGKVVNERNLEKTDKTMVDVSRYANGIYIINVTSDDGKVYTKKLIKN
ncbi:T9SS type A sorting domain-containing protein [Flavobacterium paronense]|uniref:T9SS type A sorting domain-containing protein n=1 Tax=Flavobacterium paronense TaxID=1392775 RepID=A0ABV5GFT5_9FLAO|nr:T9SS type A sorting domain-containing protein [Flavobacterium paronense]MDN3676631.1 T9SS type A sorting domain-containing protein [Flavobacterium paronense]